MYGFASLCLLACVLSTTVHAQTLQLPASLAPATTEFNSSLEVPLEAPACRLQQFYAATELTRSTVVVSSVALRFDGPAAGASGGQTITAFTLRIGGTQVGIGQLGSVFDQNLSAPLATGLDAVQVSFANDAFARPGPEPFGSSFAGPWFPLSAPQVVTVPPGGMLALEMLTRGNTFVPRSGTTAAVDAYVDPANASGPGSATPNGRGCPTSASLVSPTLSITGTFELGGSVSIGGSGFLPGAPVIPLLTVSLLQSQLALPNTTPFCWLYVDLATGLTIAPKIASPTGDLTTLPGGGATTLPLPTTPQLSGAVLYTQAVTTAMPWSGNNTGLSTSDYHTITIGQAKTATLPGWCAYHASDDSAPIATNTFFGGVALQLN